MIPIHITKESRGLLFHASSLTKHSPIVSNLEIERKLLRTKFYTCSSKLKVSQNYDSRKPLPIDGSKKLSCFTIALERYTNVRNFSFRLFT